PLYSGAGQLPDGGRVDPDVHDPRAFVARRRAVGGEVEHGGRVSRSDWQNRFAASVPPIIPPIPARIVSARSQARHKGQRVLTFDGALIRRSESPLGDAAVDFRAVPERIIGAVEHLR